MDNEFFMLLHDVTGTANGEWSVFDTGLRVGHTAFLDSNGDGLPDAVAGKVDTRNHPFTPLDDGSMASSTRKA